MVIATVQRRLEAFRRTKLYDLLAAAPVIAWFGFSAAQMLPSLSQRLKLVILFVRTDPSVLPATLVFRTVSETATLAFFALSIALYTLRYIPQRAALGFFPRFAAVAGTYSSLGFPLLRPRFTWPHCSCLSSGLFSQFVRCWSLGARSASCRRPGGSLPEGRMPSSAIHSILARWSRSPELRCSTGRYGRCCCWQWYGRSSFCA